MAIHDARRWRATARAAALAPLIAIVTASAGALPAHADLANDGACAVSGTLSFGAPITPVPQLVGYHLSGSSLLPCASFPLLSGVGFSVSGLALASCDALTTAFGSGAVGAIHVNLAASTGTSQAQQWVFPGTDPTIGNATASLAWVSPDGVTSTLQQANCYLGGTSVMSVTGTLVYEGPNFV